VIRDLPFFGMVQGDFFAPDLLLFTYPNQARLSHQARNMLARS
jgi:hypothetical protein